jgi:hypothetical protein
LLTRQRDPVQTSAVWSVTVMQNVVLVQETLESAWIHRHKYHAEYHGHGIRSTAAPRSPRC